MALETATYVANLVVTNPDGGDARSTADDHLRLIKAALVRTFPKLDGAVSLSAVQVMYMNDLSASVQLQLNQLRDGSATANNAINSRFANSASLATIATLAVTANSASYAAIAGAASLASFANSASFANVASLANFATEAGHANSASFAVLAANATAATFATTCTSASSAALLAGSPPDTLPTAQTIAKRDTGGFLEAGYFRHTTAATDDVAISHIMCMSSVANGYMRPNSIANLGSQLDGRNISTKSGTTKTLASGSGPPSLTGSTNGDIWYYY